LKLSLGSQIRMSFAFAALKLMRPFISFFSIDHARPWLDNRTVADFFGQANRDLMNLIVRPLCFAMANATPDRISFLHFTNVFNLVNATQIYKIVSGIASLPERLAMQLDIRYNCPAESLVVSDGRVTGIQLQNGKICMADHIVIATSAGAASEIVPPSLRALKRSLSGFPHTPLILAFFFLNRPTGLDAASFFNFEDDDIIFRMAIDHAKRVPDMVPSGNAVISAWTAYPESQHLLSLSDSEIEGRALQDLEHIIPGVSTWVDRAEIVRHEWGVSQYVPGLRARILDLKTEVFNIPGLSLIGADYNSVHLESAIRSARHTVSQFCREMVAEKP